MSNYFAAVTNWNSVFSKNKYITKRKTLFTIIDANVYIKKVWYYISLSSNIGKSTTEYSLFCLRKRNSTFFVYCHIDKLTVMILFMV